MKSALVTDFLNAWAAELMSGDTCSAARRFTTPVPIYLGDELMVLTDKRCAVQAMEKLRAGLIGQGVQSLRVRILAVELPRGPMQKFWVDWEHLDADGAVLATMRCDYVLRDPGYPERTMIEMANYIDFAYPSVLQTLPLTR